MSSLSHPSGAPVHDVLYLHRRDKEDARHQPREGPPEGRHEADWTTAPTPWRLYRLKTIAARLANGDPHRHRYRYREALYRAVANDRIRRAVQLLSSGRRVVTDRLHGHILTTVVGIPHDVLDNSYGKLGGFASTWGTTGAGAAGRLVHELSEMEERPAIAGIRG